MTGWMYWLNILVVWSWVVACAGQPNLPADSSPAQTQPSAAPSAGPARGQLSAWLRCPLPDQPQPKFRCDRPQLEGVTAIAGETIELSYEVENDGAGELRFWLTPHWTDAATLRGPRWRIVPPHGRAIVTISRRASPPSSGPDFIYTVSTNDPLAWKSQLIARLDVRPPDSVDEYEATQGPFGDTDRWLRPPPAEAPQPRLVCRETTADLGDVWPQADVQPAWVLENAGAAPLRVGLTEDCCTLIAPRFLIIPPNEQRSVKATVGHGRPGDFLRRVRIRTNDASWSTDYLSLKGVARVAVQSESNRFPWFEKVPRAGGPQTKTTVLHRGNGGPLHLQNPRAVPREDDWPIANLAASLRELEPGERYALDVTVSPPWPEGNEPVAQSVVQFETGVVEQPTACVTVSVSVEPRLTPRPRDGPLPRSRSAPLDWVVDLVWSDGQPAGRILGVTPRTPGLRVRTEERDGQTALVIAVPPECKPLETGGLIPSVLVFTDDPAVPQKVIWLEFSRLTKPSGG